MPYVVSARKYRPQTFEELVGQEHIAATLRNAISKGRVGHAYLFSGPRGIGKTSAARIFAKALNCEKGPTPVPCGKCLFCIEITEGRSLDLVEIDGASNRRIDEVRQLRENVRFVPSAARYKIYIIDEVHMLTPEAFNALLKTLEEPPEHIVFIFATTEPNKVPQTIRSRCQQFVFRRIPIPRIIEVLKRIAGDYGVEAEERALFWIARNASGSMRDAESILDQMISYSEKFIKEKDVFYVLGMPDYDIYHRFARFIAGEDFRSSFKLLDKLIRDGIEVLTLVSGMIEYFRNLYVLSVDESSAQLIDLPPEDVEVMKSMLPHLGSRDISNILSILSKALTDVKNSGLARELFELALIRMVRFRDIIEPAQLVERLEELKTSVLGNEAGHAGLVEPSRVISQKEEMGKTRTTPDIKTEKPSVRGALIPDARVVNPNTRDANLDTVGLNADASDLNLDTRGLNTDVGSDGDISGQKVSASVREKDIFAMITQHLRVKRRALAEFIMRAKNVSLENNTLTVVFDRKERLSYEHLSSPSTRRYIEGELGNFLKKDVRLKLVIEKNEEEPGESKLSDDVLKVLEIFKGEIVKSNNNLDNSS
ncbi:MAG: DNA polymerase III subunit gamma/tau [Spirochaetota bacterium]